MSYDPNSLETQKGKLGEKIIRRFYDERSAIVQHPDGLADGQASLIDFHVKPYGNSTIEEHLAEVKVRNAMQYAFGRYPCYTIPVAQLGLYKQYASDRDLPLILWIVDPKAGKMYSGELAPWGLENPTSIDGKEFPFNQQTKCGNMRFYHREQFIEYPLDERDIRAFEELEGNYAAKNKVPESELEQRCVEYFGKPFPEGVRAGLRELQQKFNDDDIFTAICALEVEENSKVVLEKVLTRAGSKTLTILFLYCVQMNIAKTAKGTETEPEQPAFTPSAASGENTRGQGTLFPLQPRESGDNIAEVPLADQLPLWQQMKRGTFQTAVLAPNGARIDMYAQEGTGELFILGRHLAVAVGYTKACGLFSTENCDCACKLYLPVRSGHADKLSSRWVPCDCLPVAKVYDVLTDYVGKTYGARQGTTKYSRHMEASRVAEWWKNVVLEGVEPF